MGFWGASLYANDSTCDVRDTYLGFLEDQFSNEEAYKKTLEKCNDYIGSDEELLFWVALAETQWKVGRLTPDVKANALRWIEAEDNLCFLDDDANYKFGWNKTLSNVKIKLDSPMRSEKKITKLELNPWMINDVYAYRFHRDEANDNGLFGKYMLIQKIGEFPYFERGRIHMQVHFIDCIFDELPCIEDIRRYRILPSDCLSFPLMPLAMNICIYLTSNKQYPEKHLTHIGNIQCQSNLNINYKMPMSWLDIEYRLAKFYSTWRNKKYETIEEGIFDYKHPNT